MVEILYTGKITFDKFSQLIVACHFPPEALVLTERLPEQVVRAEERLALLQFTYFSTNISIVGYTSGRIFQRDAELRWEKQEEKIHAVYIGPQEHSAILRDADLQEQHELATLKKRDKPAYYYLFGERLRQDDLNKIGPSAKPGDFAEVRIPRLLRYPVKLDQKRYIRLAVCEYIDERTGQVALFRFQGLETVE